MFRKVFGDDLMAAVRTTGIHFGAAFAQMRDRALDAFFSLADVSIDLLLMRKIERGVRHKSGDQAARRVSQ